MLRRLVRRAAPTQGVFTGPPHHPERYRLLDELSPPRVNHHAGALAAPCVWTAEDISCVAALSVLPGARELIPSWQNRQTRRGQDSSKSSRHLVRRSHGAVGGRRLLVPPVQLSASPPLTSSRSSSLRRNHRFLSTSEEGRRMGFSRGAKLLSERRCRGDAASRSFHRHLAAKSTFSLFPPSSRSPHR
jgi:hypothetical protein